jgi:hypothetical protein
MFVKEGELCGNGWNMERVYAKKICRELVLYLKSIYSRNLKTEIGVRCVETSKYIQDREYEGMNKSEQIPAHAYACVWRVFTSDRMGHPVFGAPSRAHNVIVEIGASVIYKNSLISKHETGSDYMKRKKNKQRNLGWMI